MTKSEKILLQLIHEGRYSIDEYGNIVSEFIERHGVSKAKRVIRKEKGKGYIHIGFTYNGTNYIAYAHRIVYRYYKGDITKGKEINHIDGNRQNNKPDNLEIVTGKEQMYHAMHILKTADFREHRHPEAKLNEEDFNEMHRLIKEGRGATEILRIMGKISLSGFQYHINRSKGKKK